MDNYRDGDKIYLFGFSRGAYTARALAGMIQRVCNMTQCPTSLADVRLGCSTPATTTRSPRECIALDYGPGLGRSKLFYHIQHKAKLTSQRI